LNTVFVLTEAAEADLRDIVRYTRKNWGDAQVRRYVAELEDAAELLALGKGHFRELSDIYPGLRTIRCKHHYIFCLLRNDAPALIVALFHERMDLMTRLKRRLEST
jgi:toxin ParE1/3/4